MLYPIQTLWEYNVLFQDFPYHLNVNAIIQYTKNLLTAGDLDWVQH